MRDPRARKRRVLELLRRIAVRLGALMLSLALITGALRAGSRYFYCDAMGVLLADPCMTAASHDEGPNSPAEELNPQDVDCCKVGSLPPMPHGAGTEHATVFPASLVGLLSASRFVEPSPASLRVSRSLSSGRWPGPPRFPGERRAQLMIFLT